MVPLYIVVDSCLRVSRTRPSLNVSSELSALAAAYDRRTPAAQCLGLVKVPFRLAAGRRRIIVFV